MAGRRHLIWQGWRRCPACLVSVYTILVEGERPREVLDPYSQDTQAHTAQRCELLAMGRHNRGILGAAAKHWEWAS